MIMKSASNSYDLDPIPTSLLKEIPDPIITRSPMTNILKKNIHKLKEGHVTPVLKGSPF